MSFELLWARVAKIYLGDRTLAVASLLFVYLACLGVGSFATQCMDKWVRQDKSKPFMVYFSMMLLLAALFHLVALGVLNFALDSNWVKILIFNSAQTIKTPRMREKGYARHERIYDGWGEGANRRGNAA